MVALNYELLQVAETRFNPLKERELVLRDYNIPQIENLAVLNDQYDALDLTNNRLTALANFPRMTSLATLLASGNQIAALAPDLAEQLPNLHTLNLAANRMTHLGDLDVLGQLDKLEVLLLAGNAVTRHPHYRSYVIHRCPRVRILDWEKVRDAERNAASTLFSGDEGLALAYRLSGKKPSVLRSATGKASIPGD
ncbi:L domain-like protein, partial [Caulochytrium protostelioides]